MNIESTENGIVLSDYDEFDIKKSFECGQCFRFESYKDGYIYIAKGKVMYVYQKQDQVFIDNISKEDFENLFINYFDFNRNYADIRSGICDPILKTAAEYGKGIRVFNQDIFETIISFIISANNNIPRIKLIIKRLCEKYGKTVSYDNNTYYLFPEISQLAGIKEDDLCEIKAGFRAKYIVDAVQKISNKAVDIDTLMDLDYEQAKKQLMLINGIGEKVADCVLLFSLGKTNAFPKDVWIKRILATCYDDENFDTCVFGENAGIYQQYLFYYARDNLKPSDFIKKKKHGVEYYEILPFQSHAKTLFSTRTGGVSQGCYSSMNLGISRGDKKEAVLENYNRIIKVMDVKEESLVLCAQTHTANVQVVEKSAGLYCSGSPYQDIDALITNQKNITLVGFFADCVPIFFLDKKKKVIAIAHAGWRGTADKISKNVIDKMHSSFGCNPKDILCAIGPSIGGCHFEVDYAVACRLIQAADDSIIHHRCGEKYYIDLWQANKIVLLRQGILEKNIFVSGLCTMCNTDRFFSHRALGNDRGSLAGFIALK